MPAGDNPCCTDDMAQVSLISLGFVPHGLIDARRLGIRALLHDDYFQYFTVTVSGQEQLPYMQRETRDVPDRFWPAVSVAAIEAISAAIQEGSRSGTLPLDDPSQPVDLRVDLGRVEDLMTSSRSLPDPTVHGQELGPIEI